MSVQPFVFYFDVVWGSNDISCYEDDFLFSEHIYTQFIEMVVGKVLLLLLGSITFLSFSNFLTFPFHMFSYIYLYLV